MRGRITKYPKTQRGWGCLWTRGKATPRGNSHNSEFSVVEVNCFWHCPSTFKLWRWQTRLVLQTDEPMHCWENLRKAEACSTQRREGRSRRRWSCTTPGWPSTTSTPWTGGLPTRRGSWRLPCTRCTQRLTPTSSRQRMQRRKLRRPWSTLPGKFSRPVMSLRMIMMAILVMISWMPLQAGWRTARGAGSLRKSGQG